MRAAWASASVSIGGGPHCARLEIGIDVMYAGTRSTGRAPEATIPSTAGDGTGHDVVAPRQNAPEEAASRYTGAVLRSSS